jgi:hypothetical protein
MLASTVNMGARFPDSGSTLRSIHRSHPTLRTSNPMLAKHARLDSLVLVTAPVYCAVPCPIVRDRASLETISDHNTGTIFVTYKAEAVLNDFAISRGSLEARICRKVSLASMSGRVRMYSITACSWLTSVCKARCFRRNDVKCETSGSMSYTQERPFSTQRWHEIRWPSHCWQLSALCKATESDAYLSCNGSTCLCLSTST